MHVKPLLPLLKITLLPCASVSTIVAALATLAGLADIARAILTTFESLSLIDKLWSEEVSSTNFAAHSHWWLFSRFQTRSARCLETVLTDLQ
jgi:hypothetical protein